VIVRDTSVAVSMARSAMPGCGVGGGVSIFTIPSKLEQKRDEAAAFGYPRERSFFEQRVQQTFGYPRQAPW
jgi:hypothetical protein